MSLPTANAADAGVDPSGALLFSRFAYPPNELGYCGPEDHRAILEYGAEGTADRGLVELIAGFEGAMPYLETIAAANRIADPLDHRVVDAYWIGNKLLDRVRIKDLGDTLEHRFAGQAGIAWPKLRDAIAPTARLSHAFHVFAVYPWVGLLRAGAPEHPLHVLDRCRIRWGRVTASRGPAGDHISVASRPLVFEGGAIELGPEREERVRLARDGLGFIGEPAVGDWVALHWDWVCDRLSPRRLANLGRYTAGTLELVNRTAAGLDW